MWRWRINRNAVSGLRKHPFVKRFPAAWACAFKRIFIANRRVRRRAAFHGRECGRSRIHCGESLMSLREVAMLYERIMATRRSTERLRDHNTYVASIFIGRDIQPPLPKPSCRSKRRVLLVQVMPDWLPDRRCSSTVRFPSSFSFISSRLLLRVRPRKRTYVYEQYDFNKGAFSKSQQTSAIEPPWFDSSSSSPSLSYTANLSV